MGYTRPDEGRTYNDDFIREFSSEWELEQRAQDRWAAEKAKEQIAKEAAAKEEADHRATMQRIADSLDAILAALLAKQGRN